MRLILALAVTFAAMSPLVFADRADAAKRVCGERAKMTKYLADKFTEAPRAIGVAAEGKSVVEVYTSSEGTWTLLLTTPKGKSCIMGAGHSWSEASALESMPKT